MMYVVGVFITQIVCDHRTGIDNSQDVEKDLVTYWGTLGNSVLSLYMAVTGGVDWADVVDPLKDEISIFLVPLFMLYIAFALLCVLNVITGVFVESALLACKKDKDMYMVNHVRTLFDSVDANGNGSINWEEFQSALNTDEMQEVFQQIDIDISEAEGVSSNLKACER